MDMRIVPITSDFFSPEIGSASPNPAGGGTPFSQLLDESMKNLREAQAVSRDDAYDLAMGRMDDLAAMAIHSAQATTALELTVQTASRAVSAYKEVMQMQI